MQSKEVRIAYVGGGSRGWAHTLMDDLAACPRLRGEVALYDIDRAMARLNAEWGRRVNLSPQARSPWRYTVAPSLAAALRGADFVIASIQPGPIQFMRHDLEIPARFGILHTVGDTTGPAGLARALRAVPIYARIARAIREHCPRAWVINYTNPLAACVAALYAVYPGIRAFGCCHEVFGSQEMLAGLVQARFGARPPREDIRVNVLGVNHFTWINRARWRGGDLLEMYRRHWSRKGMARRIPPREVAAMGYFQHKGQVTWDLFRRYGAMPVAGERHIVEFVPFYLKDERTLGRWGVKCTPYSFRIGRYRRLPREFRRRLADPAPFEVKASGEEGTRQMMAILGMGDLVTNVNLPNTGQVANLPRGAVVETNARFWRDSVRAIPAGALPAGVAALVARSAANQQLIVQAALHRDKDLAFQAFLNDPLMTLTTDQAWRMFQQMIHATGVALK
jgi:alpha-galactosidase